jgi:uncharacterized membrane protein YeaQ/YmgE (transglycosylase-associated protein family)
MPYQSTALDRRRALSLGVYYILLAIALAYMLFKVWPPVPWPDPTNHREAISAALRECGYAPLPPLPAASESPAPIGEQLKTAPVAMPIKFFGKCVMTSFDERLLLLVIVAGILGSFIHGATSLADYIGNDRFNYRWTWFYLLRPVIGMALALVFYFVIRGGFLTTNVGATDINPYGIAALAGLVGMFSKQATDKLSEVFSTLFKSGSGEGDEKREDPLAPKATTVIAKIDPAEAVAGSENFMVTVTGSNFVEGCSVLLNDSPQQTAFDSATQLTAAIAKESLASSGILKLTVVNPDQTRSASLDFKVNPASTPPLTVASVDPAAVSAASTAQQATVTGTGFVDGAAVNLNDAAQPTVFDNPGKLIVQLLDESIATAGTLKMKVINPDGSESPTIDFIVT